MHIREYKAYVMDLLFLIVPLKFFFSSFMFLALKVYVRIVYHIQIYKYPFQNQGTIRHFELNNFDASPERVVTIPDLLLHKKLPAPGRLSFKMSEVTNFGMNIELDVYSILILTFNNA